MKSKQNKKEDGARKYGSKEAAAAAFRAWKEAHAEDIEQANSARLEASLGKATALAAKVRAMTLHALPAWADLRAIDAIYAEGARLGLVVDHVIPLKGKDSFREPVVCGLHVAGNLRLLTKLENLQKGCRYESE
jgi:hypothetical protein